MDDIKLITSPDSPFPPWVREAVSELAAKVARVEALADEWANRKRSDGISGNAWIGYTLAGVAEDLRDALADPAPVEQQGDEGVQHGVATG